MVEEGSMRIIEVNNKKISLARWNQSLYAFGYKCPHAGGILSDGYLDPSGIIVCPLHRYKYNIKNGFNVSGEGFYMKTFPVELRSDGIYVGIEHSSLWDIFRE